MYKYDHTDVKEDHKDIVYQGIDIDITTSRNGRRYGYIAGKPVRCCIGPKLNAYIVWVAIYEGLDEYGIMCFIGFKTKKEAFNAFMDTFSGSQPLDKLRGVASYTIPKFKELANTPNEQVTAYTTGTKH